MIDATVVQLLSEPLPIEPPPVEPVPMLPVPAPVEPMPGEAVPEPQVIITWSPGFTSASWVRAPVSTGSVRGLAVAVSVTVMVFASRSTDLTCTVMEPDRMEAVPIPGLAMPPVVPGEP